jgi:hypothetical protein
MLGTALRSLRWRKRDADGERVSLLDKHETSIDWDEEEAARPEWKPKVARSRRTAVMWEPTWQQDKRPHPPSRLAVLDLFRLRNRRDERRMLLAAVLSVCSGLMTPLPAVLFGQLVQQLSRPLAATSIIRGGHVTNVGLPITSTWEQFALHAVDISDADIFHRWSAQASSFSFFYLIVAAVSMLSGYAVVGLWTRISEEQLHRVRVAYLGAVLRQEARAAHAPSSVLASWRQCGRGNAVRGCLHCSRVRAPPAAGGVDRRAQARRAVGAAGGRLLHDEGGTPLHARHDLAHLPPPARSPRPPPTVLARCATPTSRCSSQRRWAWPRRSATPYTSAPPSSSPSCWCSAPSEPERRL